MSVGLLAVRLLYRFYVCVHLSKWFTFLFMFWSSVQCTECRPTIGYNGLRLCEGEEIEAQKFSLAQQ